jgi:hypothetical protein
VAFRLFATLAAADASFKFDAAPGRLPKDVVPSSYQNCDRAGHRGPDIHGH